MNKKVKFGIIILVVLIVGVGVFLLFKNKNKLSIELAIRKGNYCEVSSDCIPVNTTACFAGCGIYVNKNEIEQISKLFKSYDGPTCDFICPPHEVVCENNKCKIKK